MPSGKVHASKFVAQFWRIVAFVVLLTASTVRAQTSVPPAAGDGLTTDTAYQIAELGNLVWMSDIVASSSGKYYKLMNDIDASDTAYWNDNGTTTALVGFPPIGSAAIGGYAFLGSFDGNNRSITGLTINRPTVNYVGLFGCIDLGGAVARLGIVGGTVAGKDCVGGLAGVTSGTITDCHTTGEVAATASGGRVGGLVGANGGTITNCCATGAIPATLNRGTEAGGLVAINDGAIRNCYATVAVSVTGRLSSDSGGLVAYNDGTISNCHATGAVSVTGNFWWGGAGGLAGYCRGTITNSYATGAVSLAGSGQYGFFAGGLVGGFYWDVRKGQATITNCYATGAVSCPDCGEVGGLVGYSDGTITRCYAAGAVLGGGPVGGLVGYSDVTITDCYATGAVAGAGQVGGLLGYNQGGAVTDCYATGRVTATARTSDFIGGLIGYASGSHSTVISSYWDVQTSGQATSGGRAWLDGGTSRTTAQMKQEATFVGWDFADTWAIQENVTYPFFLRHPPATPVNVLPADCATGVALAPTLTASAFSNPNPDGAHAASQWQVRAAASPSNWTQRVFDSGATPSALTACAVPPGVLACLTDYRWRVRYKDDRGAWSQWSAPTAFRTIPPLPAPTDIAASDGGFPDRVRVTWTGPAGAGVYVVARSTHLTTATATAASGWVTETTYDDLTAEPGVIYYYWVLAAYDTFGGGLSTFSACDSGWAGAGPAFPSNYRGAIFVVH